ncbi:MraY family glycosyltransferase [Mucilaginibacter auburnensis]|uniref:UDP-N-acetylmuramyl pentapeptide phosphotransferase/UDP-N-acetylglucosamine-1-phosphate transferase n=1 Tax=Mucilaginibacter auburnensis TaxID=1457233 RepID=A0A2H9VMB2_9SPHI|nr:MraY family glycosyltransferase [Mucilaginibacter auburnensis]PJJ79443.1 UDP-N-acetylmuramyl pentapeptide phosphotransferase/UDP-N-acetylglucosamine-1-phosphate transferase [Mucilaginibacter auburnensis]
MPELLLNNHFYYFVFIFLCAFACSWAVIPSILHVARARHLYDDIGHFRKQHDHGIPRLGGVAIFISFALSALFCSIIDYKFPVAYILAAAIILFIMGLKDDLSGVNPSTKLFIQVIAALILVLWGNIRLTSMYGVLDVYELPYTLSCILSVLVIILVINAFNLIDGIDGLAGVTGIITHVSFAALFSYTHHYNLALISIIMVGAILGFLRFNLTPAKIFMGDTGSLFIGLISVIMAIEFIESNKVSVVNTYEIYSAPALAIAILIGPIFDTLRIFFIRIVKGVGPFTADRNHIHHRMLRLGFNHMQTTFILAAINVLSIAVTLLFSTLGNYTLIILIFLISMLFNWLITFLIRSKERENLALRNLFV